MVNSPIDDSKDTAVSHTPRTPPLTAALGAFADAASQAAAGDDVAANASLDGPDDGGLDPTLLKKKKKKVKKEVDIDDEGADGAADGEGAAAGGDDDGAGGGLDLSMKKKKKKKPAVADDFAAKLKALDLDGKETGEGETEGEGEAAAGVGAGAGITGEAAETADMDQGTGIWGHDVTTPPIAFNLLLGRFYTQLELRNPDHTMSGSRSYKIPPPQCLREGNKKTIFANIVDISKRMKRTEEHLSSYLFAELGTTGSVDGNRRLVIKGRFQQKQIENVLRKYILGMSSDFWRLAVWRPDGAPLHL